MQCARVMFAHIVFAHTADATFMRVIQSGQTRYVIKVAAGPEKRAAERNHQNMNKNFKQC